MTKGLLPALSILTTEPPTWNHQLNGFHHLPGKMRALQDLFPRFFHLGRPHCLFEGVHALFTSFFPFCRIITCNSFVVAADAKSQGPSTELTDDDAFSPGYSLLPHYSIGQFCYLAADGSQWVIDKGYHSLNQQMALRLLALLCFAFTL